MPTELHQARTTFIAAAPRLVRQLVAALKASLPASPDPEDR
jgi:hypothetical protein